MKSLIAKRIAALENHFEKIELKSYDPYDGLNTPLRKLFFKVKLIERLWLQFIRLTPVNLRGIFGIKKIVHLKTVSDLLSASSILYNKTSNEKYFENADKYFFLLERMDLKQNYGTGWGLGFYFTTRFVQADTKAANLFNTVNVLNALLDYYLIVKQKSYLEQSKRIEKLVDAGIDFIVKELGYEEKETTLVWNYWEGLKTPVYNVNALMVGFLSRYQNIFSLNTYSTHISKTIEFLRQGQNSDGSWNYSADSTAEFVDGFHTGYILEGLSIAKLNGITFEDSFFTKGAQYFLNNFFTKEFFPKYYNNELYPIDGQNFAQIIQTLYYLEKLNMSENELTEKVFEKTDSVLWNEKGYYNYMKTKSFTYKTPMDRWVNAPLYLALSYLS